jgi:hypothetical protein
MKIFYSKKETKDNVTIEIKAEDDVDYEIESKEQVFTRLESFVKEKLAQQFLAN